MWCVFEAFVILTFQLRSGNECNKKFDIVTLDSDENAPTLLADGPTAVDLLDINPTLAKADRESRFPLEIIRKGLHCDIRKASATRDSDRARILDWMGREIQGGTLTVNRRLRGMLAILAWRQCLQRPWDVEYLELSKVLKEDDGAKSLRFVFSHLGHMQDEDATDLFRGIGNSVERLDLNLEWCLKLTGESISELKSALQNCNGLESLGLNIRECVKIDVGCVVSLLHCLPRTGDPQGDDRPQGDALLSDLNLKIHRLMTDKDATDLGQAIGGLNCLLNLRLSFQKISSEGMLAIGNSLPGTLRTFGLDIRKCDVCDEDLDELARCLSSRCPRLQEAPCLVKGCRKVTHELEDLIKPPSPPIPIRQRSSQLFGNVPAGKRQYTETDLDHLLALDESAGAL